MKTILIDDGLADVKMTDQDNGKHHIIVIMKGDMKAHALRTGMTDNATISYNYSQGALYLYIQFEMIEIDTCFELNIPSNPKTVNWLNYIDVGSVTDLWIAFYNGDKLTIMGSSVILTS